MKIVYGVGLLLTGLVPALILLVPALYPTVHPAAMLGVWGLGTALLLLSHWWDRGGEVRVREGRRICRCDCHVYGAQIMHCMPCCALTYKQYIWPSGRIDWETYNALRRGLPGRLGLRFWVHGWLRLLFGWAGYGRLRMPKTFVFPLVRKAWPGIRADEIVSVQPMAAATPNLFVYTARSPAAIQRLARELGHEEED